MVGYATEFRGGANWGEGIIYAILYLCFLFLCGFSMISAGKNMTVRGFFGGLLCVIGFLIALLSGGCSLLFGVGFVSSGAAQGLMMVAVIGGIPFLFGLGLYMLGAWLRGNDEKNLDGTYYKNPYAIPEEMHKTQQERETRLKKDNDFSDEKKF